MRIIVAGSRIITDYVAVERVIDVVADGLAITEIVSGAGRGVDSLGERRAREHDTPVRRFPADWTKHGRAAGPIRNRQMAEYAAGDPEGGALIAIWDGESRGTQDMIEEAKTRRLMVQVTVVGLGLVSADPLHASRAPQGGRP